MIYRDLKPSNLGFDIRGTIRLFDFGIAKELKEKDRIEGDLYKCTKMTGTRRWMAPEVFLGQPYGLKADVYSFGLMFWYVVALELPFGDIIAANHVNFVIRVSCLCARAMCQSMYLLLAPIALQSSFLTHKGRTKASSSFVHLENFEGLDEGVLECKTGKAPAFA